jgi:hypothetical protein
MKVGETAGQNEKSEARFAVCRIEIRSPKARDCDEQNEGKCGEAEYQLIRLQCETYELTRGDEREADSPRGSESLGSIKRS